MSLPPTPSQTVGPYFAIGLCRRPDHELDPQGIELTGRLLDGRDDPVEDGLIEVWDAAGRRWGRASTDSEGRFHFGISRDCHVLEAFVFARGLLRHQRTRIYLREAEDEVLASLAPARRATLLAREDRTGRLRFDIRLQGERATVFFEQ